MFVLHGGGEHIYPHLIIAQTIICRVDFRLVADTLQSKIIIIIMLIFTLTVFYLHDSNLAIK